MPNQPVHPGADLSVGMAGLLDQPQPDQLRQNPVHGSAVKLGGGGDGALGRPACAQSIGMRGEHAQHGEFKSPDFGVFVVGGGHKPNPPPGNLSHAVDPSARLRITAGKASPSAEPSGFCLNESLHSPRVGAVTQPIQAASAVTSIGLAISPKIARPIVFSVGCWQGRLLLGLCYRALGGLLRRKLSLAGKKLDNLVLDRWTAA